MSDPTVSKAPTVETVWANSYATITVIAHKPTCGAFLSRVDMNMYMYAIWSSLLYMENTISASVIIRTQRCEICHYLPKHRCEQKTPNKAGHWNPVSTSLSHTFSIQIDVTTSLKCNRTDLCQTAAWKLRNPYKDIRLCVYFISWDRIFCANIVKNPSTWH